MAPRLRRRGTFDNSGYKHEALRNPADRAPSAHGYTLLIFFGKEKKSAEKRALSWSGNWLSSGVLGPLSSRDGLAA